MVERIVHGTSELSVALGQHLGISPDVVDVCLASRTFQVRFGQVEVRDALRKLVDVAYVTVTCM